MDDFVSPVMKDKVEIATGFEPKTFDFSSQYKLMIIPI